MWVVFTETQVGRSETYYWANIIWSRFTSSVCEKYLRVLKPNKSLVRSRRAAPHSSTVGRK